MKTTLCISYLLAFILAFSAFSYSQNVADALLLPDSLVGKLKEFRKADYQRAEALDACISFFYEEDKIEDAAPYINELEQLANELNDRYWLAKSDYYQGLYALSQYDVSNALKRLNGALKRAETLCENESSQLLLARIYLAQSVGLGHINLSSEAYEQIEKGLAITNKYGFLSVQNKLINNKASVYYSLGKFDESLGLQKTLYGNTGNSNWLQNLAMLYGELEIYDTALYLIDSVLFLAKDNFEKTDALSSKCFILNKLKKWDESEVCLEQMTEFMPFDESMNGLFFMQQAEVYSGKEQYREALLAIDSAIYIARSINDISLECVCLQKKSYILRNLGDYQTALECQDSFFARYDTILARNEGEKVTAMKYQHDFDKMKQQYESRQALLRLRQKFIVVIASILVLFAAAFVFILWKNKKAKETSLKSELDYRNREITSKTLNQNQLNETLNGVIQDLTHLMNNPRGNENTLPSAIHKLKGLLDDGSKKEFDYYFVEVHPDFYTKLKADFPKLTQNELRLCALIKANLNIKDIANLNNVSIDSVKSSRKRLRKSLGISDPKIDLAEFLSKY